MLALKFSLLFIVLQANIIFISCQLQKPILLSGPYASQLLECRKNWIEISNSPDASQVAKCYTTLMLAMVPRMKGPVHVLKNPSFDPLLIKHASIADGQILKGNVTNMRVDGITKSITAKQMKIIYYPSNKTVSVVINLPRVEFTTDYNTILNIGAFFDPNSKLSDGARAEGTATGYVRNAKAVIDVHLRMSNKGGLQVASANSVFETPEVGIKFKAADVASEGLTTLMNTMVNEGNNAQYVIERTRPLLALQFAEGTGSLFHKGWKVLDQL